jgi:hypothetical protein
VWGGGGPAVGGGGGRAATALLAAAALTTAAFATSDHPSAAQPRGFASFGAVSWGAGRSVLVVARTTPTGTSHLYAVTPARHVLRLSRTGSLCGNWSPDGRRVAFFDGRQLVVVAGDGSDRFVLRTLPRSAFIDNSLTHCTAGPSWSPSGKQLAYSPDAKSVWVIDVLTGAAHRVMTTSDPAFAWSPDGTHLAITKCLNPSCNVDVIYSVSVSGNLNAMRIRGTIANGACTFAWSPSTLLASGGVADDIVVTNPKGVQTRSLNGADCVSWSTRQSLAGLAATGRPDGFIGLVIAGPAATEFQPLVAFPDSPLDEGASTPSWSTDGYHLAGWWQFGKPGGPFYQKLYTVDVRTHKVSVLIQTRPLSLGH